MDKAQINWLRQEAIQDGSIPIKLSFKYLAKVEFSGWKEWRPLPSVTQSNNLKQSNDDNEWWSGDDINYFESSGKS